MKPSIARTCNHCRHYQQISVADGQKVLCPKCQTFWGTIQTLEKVFEACPICQCRQFYIQKDFNQALGCLIMAFGILLVPVTYGLSLPVFAAIDWLLYKRVSTIVVCYKCLSEFRGFLIPEHFKNFMHHIGERYDRK